MSLGPVLAIANRGEIAARIARTARALGWQPVALLGDPDLDSYAARAIGRVERVGPAGSELDPALVVAAAKRAGATALHPGYGFLSERADLSQACLDAEISFVGPSPETLAICGDKVATREAARRADVPVLAASEPLTLGERAAWHTAAEAIGFPLMAKVVSGGGGRGLRVIQHADEVESAIESALREAGASAAGTRVYLEQFVSGARHVEVQIAGNGQDAVALGDRDCSIQRRHQKAIEEAPAFGLAAAARAALHEYAARMGRAVGLRGVGTVEFLLGNDGSPVFIEVNPRLQVEHTVTEEVAGIDLVAAQLSLVTSDDLPEPVEPRGHAIQARLYAEDPTHSFAPSPGEITLLDWPSLPGLRIDAGYQTGDSVPSFYDSLVAKVIVHAPDRASAIDRMQEALARTRVAGIDTNRPWLRAVLSDERFRSMTHDVQTANDIAIHDEPPGAVELAAVGAFVQSDTSPFRIVGDAIHVLHGNEADGWQRRIAYRRQAEDWQVLVEQEDNFVDPDDNVAVRAGIAIVPTADAYDVSSVHGRWQVGSGPLIQRAESGAASDGVLRAPMPGTVVAVHATAGAVVKQGDALAVMVAMKIEIVLAAPFNGVIERVHCAVNDLVSSRQPLVTVRPVNPSDG
ncbi:MAG: ATP-grasp domain-containing protein [Thermomicrobiales bacterium]|nr:ATP-grasp domain-containing protein [Thermomicrobiales bacterium]